MLCLFLPLGSCSRRWTVLLFFTTGTRNVIHLHCSDIYMYVCKKKKTNPPNRPPLKSYIYKYRARIYIYIFLLKFHIGGSTFFKLAFLHASLLPTHRVFLKTNFREKKKKRKKEEKKKKEATLQGNTSPGTRTSTRLQALDFMIFFLCFGSVLGIFMRTLSDPGGRPAPGARGAQRRGRDGILRVPGSVPLLRHPATGWPPAPLAAPVGGGPRPSGFSEEIGERSPKPAAFSHGGE